ncbi:MAG: glutamate--tRNA ligase [Pseudomonadota bacterium]
MTVKVRFAPSPTGRLHVGNVRAALWNWLFAHKSGGTFVLRIDDTDQERSTAEFEDGIRNDLTWLGLVWGETFKQSDRFDEYNQVADKLKELGLLYPCYETPEELDRKRKLQRARGLPPVYDRAALDLTDEDRAKFEAEGRQPHWRFKLSQKPVAWQDLIRGETTVDTASVSDPVLIRADGMYLYTLPSCVDDIDTGITHVIRGEDHVTNTAVQVELMGFLIDHRGGGTMPAFAHHSLLVGADGEGLSKRLGSLSIESMRDSGIEPQAITSLLARLGTSEPVVPVRDLNELAQGFDFDRVGRAPARFAEADLQALNAKILQEMPYQDLESRLSTLGVSETVWNAVHGNIEKLSDAADWRDVIESDIAPPADLSSEDKAMLQAAVDHVPVGDFGEDSWQAFTAAVKEATGRKGKGLFMPLRLALTGQARGPEMDKLFVLIGPDKARTRLKNAAS